MAHEIIETVSSKARELYTSLEEQFSGDIKINVIDHDSEYETGRLTIDENGDAIILIASHSLDAETTLVHELCHLKMRINGFPTVFGFFQPANRQEVSRVELKLAAHVVQEIKEIVLHAIFFEDMRAMGYRPGAQVEVAFRKLIESEQLPVHPADWIIAILRASLECADSSVAETLKSRSPQDTLRIADQALELIRKSVTTAPDEMVRCVSAVCNLILNPFHLAVDGIEVVDSPSGEHVPHFGICHLA